MTAGIRYTSIRQLFVAAAMCASWAGASHAQEAPADAEASPSGNGLALEECQIQGLERAVRCGSLTVFEDRTAGTGRTIELNLVVVPALDADAEPDPIFMLAGGPGQGAASLAPFVNRIFPEALTRRRDIVLVDQRGTGASNGLFCELNDLNDLLRALAFDLAPDVMSACRDGFDADLTLYTTPIAMDDLDDVRQALGYEQINLWGGSYGTRAALVYIRQHPANVRTAVLRGVAPTGAALPLYFARDAQRALDLLLAACDASETCNTTYPDTEGQLEELLARLAEQPATISAPHPVTRQPAEGLITDEVFAGGLRLVQYGTPFSRQIPLIVDRAAAGDFEPFLAVTMPFALQILSGLSLGMFLSVVCAEDVPYIDPEVAAMEAEGSYLGDHASRYMIRGCEDWPRGELPDGYRDPVRTDIPVLVVSGDEDPVTPPSWGEQVLEHMPNGTHLVIPRSGHVPSLPGCASDLAAEFIAAGSADGLVITCLNKIPRPEFAVGGESPSS